MAIAAFLSLISHFGKSVLTFLTGTTWPFLKKNWRQVSWWVFFIWAILCLLSHCTGVINPFGKSGSGDTTVTVMVDTTYLYPDTNAIFAMHGFDTLPNHVKYLENRLRFKSKTPVFPPYATCRDSIMVLRAFSEMQSVVMAECDSAYAEAIAVRTYGDTLRNDSIEVAIGLRVQGHLRGEPIITYRYLRPYPVITIERTIQMPPTAPNRRIYLEGGIGVAMTWGNELNAISGSLGLGYENRKGWSFGPRGTFNQNFYMVEGTLRKSFGLGRNK